MNANELLASKLSELLSRRQRMLGCLDGIRQNLSEINSELKDLEAAGRVLGVPIDVPKEHHPKARAGSVKEAIINCLRSAGTDGLRTAIARQIVEREIGVAVHPKTIGMTLFRMKARNEVVREGHIWWLREFSSGIENKPVSCETGGA